MLLKLIPKTVHLYKKFMFFCEVFKMFPSHQKCSLAQQAGFLRPVSATLHTALEQTETLKQDTIFFLSFSVNV